MNTIHKIELLRYESPDKSLQLARHHFERTENLDCSLALASEVGSCLKSLGRNTEARQWLDDVIEEATGRRDRKNRGNALWRLAQLNLREGRLNLALASAGEAIIDGSAAGCTDTEGRGFQVRAAIFFHSDHQIESYQDAIAARKKLTRDIDLAAVAIGLHQNALKLGIECPPDSRGGSIQPACWSTR